MKRVCISRAGLAVSLLLSVTFALPGQAEEAPETPAAAPAGAENGFATVTLKKHQALVKGLLVQEVKRGEYIGAASQMNATATPGASGEAVVIFNQEVGDMMSGALREVQKFLTVRHHGWPQGLKIEVAFEEKYSPKDGPSAAVACALMLDSLITGDEMDSAFAITGDMNADGSVRPVGGVPAKISGAAAKGCRIVAIPEKNAAAIYDSLLLSGPAALWKIQVFTVGTFEEAHAVASAKRSPEFEAAITDFTDVQRVLSARPKETSALLKNQKMQERLQKILSAVPTHLSAQLLLNFGRGTMPKTLSLGGSWESVGNATVDLIEALREGKPEALKDDTLATSITALGKMRNQIDPRLKAYVDRMQDFAKLARRIIASPPSTREESRRQFTRLQECAVQVANEEKRLMADKSMREEMMRE